MHPVPEISLRRLREIGCANWDVMPEPRDAAHVPPDFDPYLIEAVARLRDGTADDEVADYLITAETECMGVDSGSGMRDRALALTEAIRDYVEGSAL